MTWTKNSPRAIDAEADREGWLAARMDVVTGTGMSILMGDNPWKDEESLLQKYLVGDNFKLNRKMAWGLNDEEHIGRATARSLGCAFFPSHMFVESSTHPVGATEDGKAIPLLDGQETDPWPVCPSGHIKNWEAFVEEATSFPQGIQLEIKCSGEDQLKYWNKPKSGPPRHYWAQCQAQMFCFGLTEVAIVAKIGAHDIRGHVVYRDDEYLEEAAEKSVTFMNRVMEGRELL